MISTFRNLLKSINGVVVPGGGANLQSGYGYYDALTMIYEISKEVSLPRPSKIYLFLVYLLTKLKGIKTTTAGSEVVSVFQVLVWVDCTVI